MTFEEAPTGLIPWFSKTEGNTYATIVASPSPLRGKPMQAQDVSRSYLENWWWWSDLAAAAFEQCSLPEGAPV